MIKHGVDVIKAATSKVNRQQISVITVHQTLYAKAKVIQWAWYERYEEKQFVVLFGSLHIEQAFMRAI